MYLKKYKLRVADRNRYILVPSCRISIPWLHNKAQRRVVLDVDRDGLKMQLRVSGCSHRECLRLFLDIKPWRAWCRISFDALASSRGVVLQFVSRRWGEGTADRGFNLHRIIPSKSDAFHYTEAMRESGLVFVDTDAGQW